MMKKKNIALYIILNIITFGIYGIVFWYKWTKDINKLFEGDDKDSANYLLILVLNIFSFGINIFAWNYQMGERLYQNAERYGVEIKHGGLFIMIMRLIPFASSVFKISYINKFIAAYNANASVATVATVAPAEETVAE